MSIQIKFNLGGTVEIKPVGYPGRTCFDATRPYSNVFGGKQEITEIAESCVSQSIDEVQQQQTGNK